MTDAIKELPLSALLHEIGVQGRDNSPYLDEAQRKLKELRAWKATMEGRMQLLRDWERDRQLTEVHPQAKVALMIMEGEETFQTATTRQPIETDPNQVRNSPF